MQLRSEEVPHSSSVCSHDLDDCISYFSDDGSSVRVYALVHKSQSYVCVERVGLARGHTNTVKNLGPHT